VQLPGVQDVAKAKDLIGRTATLEVRLVDQEAMISGNDGSRRRPGPIPERTRGGSTTMVAVKKQVVLTGDRFKPRAGHLRREPANRRWRCKLDAAGGRIMRDVTRENLKKLMAILLFEKGQGEAISVATIQGEFGDRFQITGQFSPEETNTLAILIRSGALAAPMEIIEERVIGPSLGADNIAKGFDSTLWGFVAIAVFMIAYYLLFGVVSTVRAGGQPAVPDCAAVAAAGHADPAGHRRHRADAGHGDRRQRADQRAGTRRTAQRRSPQAAITAGYERAWATILDSNITTLIAGIALLIFGSGPVRGFAVVHCLGILTSIFSSVVVSRAMVNLIYGRAGASSTRCRSASVETGRNA
jgi:preprotein translocase subunit SecD